MAQWGRGPGRGRGRRPEHRSMGGRGRRRRSHAEGRLPPRKWGVQPPPWGSAPPPAPSSSRRPPRGLSRVPVETASRSSFSRSFLFSGPRGFEPEPRLEESPGRRRRGGETRPRPACGLLWPRSPARRARPFWAHFRPREGIRRPPVPGPGKRIGILGQPSWSPARLSFKGGPGSPAAVGRQMISGGGLF